MLIAIMHNITTIYVTIDKEKEKKINGEETSWKPKRLVSLGSFRGSKR